MIGGTTPFTLVILIIKMDIVYTDKFQSELIKTIKGYHLVSSCPIKEAVWESILAQTLSRCECKNTWKPGCHESGKDITIGDQGISCKSTKLAKKSFAISSYRMTLCNSGEEFTREIDLKRNNFSHYAILARQEKQSDISYNLYMIPAEEIKAASKSWTEHRNKDKSKIKKWTTDSDNGYYMSVVASMSNQLWIKVDRKKFDKFIVVKDINVTASNTLDYAEMFDKLSLS